MPDKQAENHLWLPPTQLRRYEWSKIACAAIMLAIFGGWSLICWPNTAVLVTTITLLAITVWTVVQSIVIDWHRVRHRQVEIEKDQLMITTPAGILRIALHTVAEAQWRDDPSDQIGLWLYDQDQAVIGHLDASVLTDQSEARAFLCWARQRATLAFSVKWP